MQDDATRKLAFGLITSAKGLRARCRDDALRSWVNEDSTGQLKADIVKAVGDAREETGR
jgi:hypothetical protein